MSAGVKALSLWAGVGLIVLLLVLAAIAYGAVPLTARSVIDAIGGRGDAVTIAIVRTLRLPRALLALLVGAGLGMAGAALQGALRNALAEPYLLGVSGGAAVGAVVAVSLGASGPFILPLASFAGAALAIAVALLVARAGGGRSDPRVLLMAGVIVGAFANAAIMVLLSNAPPNAVRNALWWMMGSVGDAGWLTIGWLAVYVAAGRRAAPLVRTRDRHPLARRGIRGGARRRRRALEPQHLPHRRTSFRGHRRGGGAGRVRGARGAAPRAHDGRAAGIARSSPAPRWWAPGSSSPRISSRASPGRPPSCRSAR